MEIYYLNEKQDKYIISGSSDDLNNIPSNKLVWIRMPSPTDDEINLVAEKTKIPPDEFREFIEDEERSRVEYKGYLHIIYQAPISINGEISTEAVAIFVNKNIIVSLGRNVDSANQKIVKSLQNNKLKYQFKSGPGRFVYFMLDRINDEFFVTIEKISRLVSITKSDDLNVQQKELVKLYNSNVTLSHFNQAIIANLEVTNTLRKNRFKHFKESDIEHFADLHYDLMQLLDTAKIQREVILSIFTFQSVFSSYKLNEFLKNLTSFTLIFMLPTLMASMYGMNLRLPLSDHPNGFWIISGIMFAITLGVYFWFKKIDWL